MTIEQELMSNKDVKVEEKIYERLYKIKDSQLKPFLILEEPIHRDASFIRYLIRTEC